VSVTVRDRNTERFREQNAPMYVPLRAASTAIGPRDYRVASVGSKACDFAGDRAELGELVGAALHRTCRRLRQRRVVVEHLDIISQACVEAAKASASHSHCRRRWRASAATQPGGRLGCSGSGAGAGGPAEGCVWRSITRCGVVGSVVGTGCR
jgi:hypothetical protein